MPFCKSMVDAAIGYPNTPVTKSLYNEPYEARTSALQTLLAPQTAKDEKKRLKNIYNHLILPDVRCDVTKLPPVVPTFVVFQRQFNALSSNVFVGWDENAWNNVFVAGGAVLSAIIPIPPGHELLKARDRGGLEWDFRGGRKFTRPERCHLEPPRNADKFMFDSRFPGGDIDVFFYGLSPIEAERKLLLMLEMIRTTVKLGQGVDTDVVFVRTTNTVTIDSGARYRKIQIITRLYSSRESVINSFDVDCCCVGYDGSNVMINDRAIEALKTRINVVDLDIRSDTTENRLLKYAERGFAINVTEFDRKRLDRTNLTFELAYSSWGGNMTLDGDDWGRLCDAQGIERLLAVESASNRWGGAVPDDAFKSRKRKVKKDPEDKACHYSMVVNAGGGRQTALRGFVPWQ